MKVVVLQSSYLPWKGYFDLIHEADRFVFYDEVKYTKNDWRNRNRLYCRNAALHWLTIPVSKKAVKDSISAVRLTDPSWQKKHLQAIRSCYGSATHFSDLEPLLDAVYSQRQWESLSDLNHFTTEMIAGKLGSDTEFLDSSRLQRDGDRVTRLLNILTELGATEYISGPSARGYLSGSLERFAANGIRVRFKDYSGYPRYSQFDNPFMDAVSIIDLIAHQGFTKAPYFVWGHAASRTSSTLTRQAGDA